MIRFVTSGGNAYRCLSTGISGVFHIEREPMRVNEELLVLPSACISEAVSLHREIPILDLGALQQGMRINICNLETQESIASLAQIRSLSQAA